MLRGVSNTLTRTALRTRHCPATPMRVSLWLGLQGGVDHSLHTRRIVSRFPPPAWSNLPKRLQTVATESLSPQTDRLTVHAVLRRNRTLGFTGSNSEDHAAAQRYLLWCSQRRQPAFNLNLLVR